MLKRFQKLWEKVEGQPAYCQLNFDIIEALYSKPGRYYHNLDHVQQCLEELDFFPREIIPDRARTAIELALWYHDVIYCVDGTRDSEGESALLATQMVHYLPGVATSEVVKLIKATKHIDYSMNPIQKRELSEDIISDIDLSILGKSSHGIMINGMSQDFFIYNRLIRLEYITYPDPEYDAGRQSVLMSFLSKDRIYATDYFYRKYEEQARLNIKLEIEILKGGQK